MKVCYNNFWRSDKAVRLQCEFDTAAGVSAEDIKDIVFSKYYDIAITTALRTPSGACHTRRRRREEVRPMACTKETMRLG